MAAVPGLIRDGWGWLVSSWWLVIGGVVCAAGVWAAVCGWWRRRAEAALVDRVAVDLVPSVNFDPPMESVAWFAGQLARVPAAAGAAPRRAQAVRIRLSCKGGKLAYGLEGPARAASVLRMSAYPGVEVVEAHEIDATSRISFEGAPPLRKPDVGVDR